MEMKRLSLLVVLVLMLGFVPVALADGVELVYPDCCILTVGPSGAILTGQETGQPLIDAAIAAYLGYAPNEVYKSNVGGSEAGALAGNYTTTYYDTPGDPTGAMIVWDGGAYVSGSPIYMLVKDGNATPAWYFFNLTALGWNGTDILCLSGFWAGTNGSISHVTLYGTSTTVPEPGTLTLLGLGLLDGGLAWRRRK